MDNKKEKLLKDYVLIYRPILEKEKKNRTKEELETNLNWGMAA